MSIELRKKRRIAGTVLIGISFLFLLFAVGKNQLIDGDKHRAEAKSLSVSASTVKAARGEILDSNGSPLVVNRQGNSVVFKYSEFPAAKEQEKRNELIIELAKRGISTNVHYKPLPLLSAYKNLGFDIDDYPRAYSHYECEITLPLHTLLSDDDVDYITENIKDLLGK